MEVVGELVVGNAVVGVAVVGSFAVGNIDVGLDVVGDSVAIVGVCVIKENGAGMDVGEQSPVHWNPIAELMLIITEVQLLL